MRFFLLWILIGFAINVAVAWGLAAWLPQTGWTDVVLHGNTRLKDSLLTVRDYRTRGACRRAWMVMYYDRSSLSELMSAMGYSDGQYSLEYDGPLKGQQWGRAESIRANPAAFGQDGMEYATGWPLLTAWCDWAYDGRWWSPTRPAVVRGGISITRAPAKGRASPVMRLHALPYRPIWLGVVVNTLFYAVLLAVPFASLVALRAWRRGRRKARGRCTRCAYDLTGLGAGAPCPECGVEARVLSPKS